MIQRRIETWIAKFTLGFLVIYIPIETWTSLPYGLLNPFYLVDCSGNGINGLGGILSLKLGPSPSPEILCVAYSWATANGWRATFWRVDHIKKGGDLDRGMTELWGLGIVTSLAIIIFCILIYLVVNKINRSGNKL